MSYPSSMLSDRVTVLHPTKQDGRTGPATAYREGRTLRASVDWSRGTRALRQGDVTVYDVLMVRTRWTADLTRHCRLLIDGRAYVIESYNADRHANTIQITATETTMPHLVERKEAEG